MSKSNNIVSFNSKKYNVVEYGINDKKILASFNDKKNALTFLKSLESEKNLTGKFYSIRISNLNF